MVLFYYFYDWVIFHCIYVTYLLYPSSVDHMPSVGDFSLSAAIRDNVSQLLAFGPSKWEPDTVSDTPKSRRHRSSSPRTFPSCFALIWGSPSMTQDHVLTSTSWEQDRNGSFLPSWYPSQLRDGFLRPSGFLLISWQAPLSAPQCKEATAQASICLLQGNPYLLGIIEHPFQNVGNLPYCS